MKLNYIKKQVYLDLGKKEKLNSVKIIFKYQKVMDQLIKLKKYHKFGQDFK